MSVVEDFLTAQEEKSLIKAIAFAEKNTSGEIRVHIENTSEKPPLERAMEVFYLLEMEKTKHRNGVLFYVAVKSKKFAIIGDEGINKKVPDNFWDSEKDLIRLHFSQKEYAIGLEKAIIEVGQKLKMFFPYQTNDTNELPDEISKG